MIDESIFREYDIRGIVPHQINEHSIKLISHAIAKKCNGENIHELSISIKEVIEKLFKIQLETEVNII